MPIFMIVQKTFRYPTRDDQQEGVAVLSPGDLFTGDAAGRFIEGSDPAVPGFVLTTRALSVPSKIAPITTPEAKTDFCEIATIQSRVEKTDRNYLLAVAYYLSKNLGEFGKPDDARVGPFQFSLEEWRTVIDTNLTSVFLMCRALVPLMKGQGYGRIINLSSIMSHVALPQRTAYCASKSALLGFSRALALELVAEKITVNGISPGPFATEMNTPILQNPEANAAFVARIPIGRWGDVREIGQLALYLCSDDAGFITGTDILIDGGWTAQ